MTIDERSLGLPVESDITAVAAHAGRLDRSAWSWALWQSGRDPYIGLVSGVIFAPFLATVVIHDPVRGQAFFADNARMSGLIVAFVAPILGMTVDQIGPRKPWLLLGTLLLAPLMASLWFVKPGPGSLSLPLISAELITISVLMACCEVLFSSMLVHAVRPTARSEASGAALAIGNINALVLMAILLVVYTWPKTPLFGLSNATHEADRIIGPLCGLTLVLFAAPLFLFARDAPKGVRANFAAVTAALRAMLDVIKRRREYANALLYLGVRTVSQDAGGVLLFLSGVYAAGVMRWGIKEMVIFGLVSCVSGFVGGWAASRFDRAFGPKAALQVEIVGVLLTLIGMLGSSPTTILFLPASDHVIISLPSFRTLPEWAFQFWSFVGSAFLTSTWATARTLMTRLVPPNRQGSFFGLAALAACCTGWIGPTLVGVFTRAFKSQQAGFAPIALLLLLGLAGLFFVRDKAAAAE